MKTIFVKSSKSRYKVVVGKDILSKTGALLSGVLRPRAKVMIVSQKNIRKYAARVSRSLQKKGYKVFIHILPDGERAKSEKEVFNLLHALLAKGFERKDGVVAVGGGVVSDLAGFAASVYLRGIPYVNVATTLLAQVDSSIGGKTGINLSEGKNLMGAFYPPAVVISDVTVLKSLPQRELCASLAEVVKYGVIRDPGLFRFLEKETSRILKKDLRALEKIVIASAQIKAGVVSRDEFETKGERMILNYGHTFGHGIEGASRYKKVVHGEAVAMGMVMAAHAAVELGLCSQDVLRRQKALLQKLHLPVSFESLRLQTSAVFKAMMKDKKKTRGKLRFVLPTRIGKVIIKADFPIPETRTIIRLFGSK